MQQINFWEHLNQGNPDSNGFISTTSKPGYDTVQESLVSEQAIIEDLDRLGLFLDPVWVRRIDTKINAAFAERMMFSCNSWVVTPFFKRRILFWQTLFIEIYPIAPDDAEYGVIAITPTDYCSFYVDEGCWRVISHMGDQVTSRLCQEKDLVLTVVQALDLPSVLWIWTTRLLAEIDEAIYDRHECDSRVMHTIATLIKIRLAAHVTPQYAIGKICEQLLENRVAGQAVAQAVVAFGDKPVANFSYEDSWLERMCYSAITLTDVSLENQCLVPLFAVLAKATNTKSIVDLKKKLHINSKTCNRLRHLNHTTLILLSKACPSMHRECFHFVAGLTEVLATVDSLAKSLRCREGDVNLEEEMISSLRLLARVESHCDDKIRFLNYEYVLSLLWGVIHKPLPPITWRGPPEEDPIPTDQVALLLRLYIQASSEDGCSALKIDLENALHWMRNQGVVIDRNQEKRGWRYIEKRVAEWHADLETERGDSAKTFLSMPSWKCKLSDIPESVWWPRVVPTDSPYAVRPLITPDSLQEEGSAMKHCVLSYAPRCAQGMSRIFSVYEANLGSRVATVELWRPNGDHLWTLHEMKGFQNSELMQLMDIPDDPLNEIVTRLICWYNSGST